MRLGEKTTHAKCTSIQFDDWSDKANRSFTGIHGSVIIDDPNDGRAKFWSFTLASVPHDAFMAPNADNLADLIYAETKKQPWWNAGRCHFAVSDTTNLNPSIVSGSFHLRFCHSRVMG
jgi:hypothetical protein